VGADVTGGRRCEAGSRTSDRLGKGETWDEGDADAGADEGAHYVTEDMAAAVAELSGLMRLARQQRGQMPPSGSGVGCRMVANSHSSASTARTGARRAGRRGRHGKQRRLDVGRRGLVLLGIEGCRAEVLAEILDEIPGRFSDQCRASGKPVRTPPTSTCSPNRTTCRG
jgi:hypothetical protein